VSTMEVRHTLEALANGIDPVTGEVLADWSPCHHPPVIRALFYAARPLERLVKPARSSHLSGNAGKPWSKEEDATWLEAFDQGVSVKELAERHARTRGSIESRLVRHGRWAAAASQDFKVR
jgi:hypothetical protein